MQSLDINYFGLSYTESIAQFPEVSGGQFRRIVHIWIKGPKRFQKPVVGICKIVYIRAFRSQLALPFPPQYHRKFDYLSSRPGGNSPLPAVFFFKANRPHRLHERYPQKNFRNEIQPDQSIHYSNFPFSPSGYGYVFIEDFHMSSLARIPQPSL